MSRRNWMGDAKAVMREKRRKSSKPQFQVLKPATSKAITQPSIDITNSTERSSAQDSEGFVYFGAAETQATSPSDSGVQKNKKGSLFFLPSKDLLALSGLEGVERLARDEDASADAVITADHDHMTRYRRRSSILPPREEDVLRGLEHYPEITVPTPIGNPTAAISVHQDDHVFDQTPSMSTSNSYLGPRNDQSLGTGSATFSPPPELALSPPLPQGLPDGYEDDYNFDPEASRKRTEEMEMRWLNLI